MSIILKDILLAQSLPPFTGYRFWDEKEQKMYTVESMSFCQEFPSDIVIKYDSGTMVKTMADGVVIPTTDLYCKLEESGSYHDVCYGDLVRCDYLDGDNKVRMVFWDNGWRVLGSDQKEFAANVQDRVFYLGNKWQNPELYKQYQELLKEE